MFSNLLDFILRRPRLLAELNGHTGPVISLAISPNGKLLASGATDGVRVWDLTTREELIIPQQPLQERGQVSCVCWITRQNERCDTLCYGNALGYLVFLQHRQTEQRFEVVHSVRIARGGEILSLAAESSGGSATRIATGTRDKCVQVWSFDSSTRKLVSIHSNAFSQEKDIIPKSLAFDDNEGQDLLVFGLFDGGLHRYGGGDGKWVATHQLSSKIGNAAIDLKHRTFIVDNVSNGFDLYKLDTGHFLRTLVTKDPIKTYPKGVAFANKCQAVVGGSDHGHVYIFERKTGKVIQTIKHARDGGVQTIAIFDCEGTVVIATASASTLGLTPIRVWQWSPVQTENPGKRRPASYFINTTRWLLHIIVIAAAAAYCVGIIRGQGRYQLIPPRNKSALTVSHNGLNEVEIREYIRREMLEEMSQMKRTAEEGTGLTQADKNGEEKENIHKSKSKSKVERSVIYL